MSYVVHATVSDEDVAHLVHLLEESPDLALAGLDELAEYVLHAVADGIRRPGSWERAVVESLFGWPPYTFKTFVSAG